MAELGPGAAVPDIDLASLDAERTALSLARGRLPAALFFFKVDCPTCPVAAPAIERLHQAYGGAAARVVGVSQDGAAETRQFLAAHGASFPTLVDDPELRASAAFGLVVVPTLVLVGSDGRVERVEEGFSRQAYNEVSQALAVASGRPYQPVSVEADGSPAWKPG